MLNPSWLVWTEVLLCTGSSPEVFGRGVMMYISANVVQFTLGAKCKHVHATSWKWYRWCLED